MSKIFKDEFVSHLIGYQSYIINNALSLNNINKLKKPFFITLKTNSTKKITKKTKDNIKTIEEPIYKLRQLRGVEYEWNDKQNTYESGSLDSGIIAQDVQQVMPSLVSSVEDLNDTSSHLAVDYNGIIGLLIETVKEQQNQIDTLKAQLQA